MGGKPKIRTFTAVFEESPLIVTHTLSLIKFGRTKTVSCYPCTKHLSRCGVSGPGKYRVKVAFTPFDGSSEMCVRYFGEAYDYDVEDWSLPSRVAAAIGLPQHALEQYTDIYIRADKVSE